MKKVMPGWVMQNRLYTLILLVVIAAVICTYLLVKDTPWKAHLMEWLNIVIRVMHITFGIAWIGASFLFCVSGECTQPHRRCAG